MQEISQCTADALVGKEKRQLQKHAIVIDVTTCITLSYRHGNYVTDKHTTCYQREEEAKDAKKYFRNLVIFHKTLRLDFSNQLYKNIYICKWELCRI